MPDSEYCVIWGHIDVGIMRIQIDEFHRCNNITSILSHLQDRRNHYKEENTLRIALAKVLHSESKLA